MTDGVATIPASIVTPTGAERVPPHSDEAEISVLGGMLLEETAADRAMEILDQEDFYHPAHRRIFAAINDLRDQGHAPQITGSGRQHGIQHLANDKDRPHLSQGHLLREEQNLPADSL